MLQRGNPYLAIVNPLYAFPRWSMRNEKGANLKDAALGSKENHQCSPIFSPRGTNWATKASITHTKDFPAIIAFWTTRIVYELITYNSWLNKHPRGKPSPVGRLSCSSKVGYFYNEMYSLHLNQIRPDNTLKKKQDDKKAMGMVFTRCTVIRWKALGHYYDLGSDLIEVFHKKSCPCISAFSNMCTMYVNEVNRC